jgi:hypothetical protein
MLSSSCDLEKHTVMLSPSCDSKFTQLHHNLHDDSHYMLCSEQKMAEFRTHDLTKERAYVSTQQSGQLDTFLLNHFSVYLKLA